MLAGLLSPSGG
ncbi:hypothetical protein MKD33_11630, partial [Chromobacterium piscinae]